MSKKERVNFQANRNVDKKVDVVFKTRSGEKVSFEASKRVPKQVHVSFYAKKHK